MWRSGLVAVLVVLVLMATACARRGPRLAVDPPVDLAAFVAAHPAAAGQPARVDEVGRTATASYHVVQLQTAERPHVHAAHELTVVMLRGQGTLTRAGSRIPLAAGDTAVIPRGVVHWFAPEGARAVSFVVFSPPLDAPDTVPVPGAQ